MQESSRRSILFCTRTVGMSPTSVTTFSFQVGIALKDSLSVVENTRTQAWAPKNQVQIQINTNQPTNQQKKLWKYFKYEGFSSFSHKSALLPPQVVSCVKPMVINFPDENRLPDYFDHYTHFSWWLWVCYLSNYFQHAACMQGRE